METKMSRSYEEAIADTAQWTLGRLYGRALYEKFSAKSLTLSNFGIYNERRWRRPELVSGILLPSNIGGARYPSRMGFRFKDFFEMFRYILTSIFFLLAVSNPSFSQQNLRADSLGIDIAPSI